MNTNEIVMLCEAAGFDIVILETVGLGQVREARQMEVVPQ